MDSLVEVVGAVFLIELVEDDVGIELVAMRDEIDGVTNFDLVKLLTMVVGFAREEAVVVDEEGFEPDGDLRPLSVLFSLTDNSEVVEETELVDCLAIPMLCLLLMASLLVECVGDVLTANGTLKLPFEEDDA